MKIGAVTMLVDDDITRVGQGVWWGGGGGRLVFFFFNDTATTEIYTLSLHDALPICREYLW